jgi:hypothetical protein
MLIPCLSIIRLTKSSATSRITYSVFQRLNPRFLASPMPQYYTIRYYEHLANRLAQFTASHNVSSLSWHPGAIRPVTRGRIKGIAPRVEDSGKNTIGVRSSDVSSSDGPSIVGLPRGILVKRTTLQIAPRVEAHEIPTVVDCSKPPESEFDL